MSVSDLQPATPVSSSPPPPPSVRLPAASQPDLGTPRESTVVARYLHDPSLRYTRVPFAGPPPIRLALLIFAALFSLGLLLVPLVRQATTSGFSGWTLLSLAGIPLCLELFVPLRNAIVEWHNQLRFWNNFRGIDLGLDRAVPQPGTSLRYEVHLAARRRVTLAGVHVRLVFWESWRGRARMRWLRIPHRVTQKQGHDLVRHELSTMELAKMQHAVIRGALRVPGVRPTEHHRGKPKHISYVNVTVTVLTAKGGDLSRGNGPHLVTFPWM